MSTVRMCDFEGCGTIFSEREVGWSTGQITTVGEDGKRHVESADFCPEHTSTRDRPLPRFKALPAHDQSEDKEAQAWLDGKPDAFKEDSRA